MEVEYQKKTPLTPHYQQRVYQQRRPNRSVCKYCGKNIHYEKCNLICIWNFLYSIGMNRKRCHFEKWCHKLHIKNPFGQYLQYFYSHIHDPKFIDKTTYINTIRIGKVIDFDPETHVIVVRALFVKNENQKEIDEEQKDMIFKDYSFEKITSELPIEQRIDFIHIETDLFHFVPRKSFLANP